jgi:mannose-1-phosphate guanylyltransferase/mannose-6-phosphate isomerase
MSVYPVIMCGGAGTRLWPASRPSRPKQFLPLVGELSIFQDTVRRVEGIGGAEQVIVVAGSAHADWIRHQLAEIGSRAVVLLEPQARDSAPAMAAAAAWIEMADPDGVAVVVASDHHIPEVKSFRRAADTAVAAARTGRIVTLGVRPTAPTSAYGYIRPEASTAELAPVKAFVEKPDTATAARYLGEGYLWNSGNFVVSAKTLLEELERHAPGVAKAARVAVSEAVEVDGAWRLSDAFVAAPKISIDYAVMEKTDRASVLPVDFPWSDLGAWDSVLAASDRDEAGNAAVGQVMLVDAADCLVRAEPGIAVAAVGVRNLAIVAEGDAVLVCDLSASQSVKVVVEGLKAASRPQVDVASAPRLSLRDWADRYEGWLFTAALPLWWAVGADHEGWGFHEGIRLDGAPLDDARRARVQTRQTFVYGTAGTMGWRGPWRQATIHGADGFLDRYRRPDGLYRARVAEDGRAADEMASLYEQAFVLLALASAAPVHPRAAEAAEALLVRIRQTMGHAAGGFVEAGERPFQSNPHMHLFEACLAWGEASGGEIWRLAADEIAALALDHFIDAERGFAREFFNSAWRPADGDDGRLVEPGHQFEWAWLLKRWSRISGDPAAAEAAKRLYAAGLKGVDPARGVVVDELWDDLTVRSPRARLWPQTERLKAALILGDDPEAERAAAGLWLYLQTEVVGLWRDKLKADGTFVDEPAPASSLYHIVVAVDQLRRSVSAA